MKKKPEPQTVNIDLAPKKAELKVIGGSDSDAFNNEIANQAVRSLWRFGDESKEDRDRKNTAAISALVGMAPRDELEGMLAAQLLATHHAAMECHRRAMIREQTFEGRRENLSQANKLSRTYTTLLEALNRHRGKGQQKVTVEHVHVHEGGQAIVGVVDPRGGGAATETGGQPHALGYAPGPTMPCPDAPRDAVPVAGDAERPLQDARRAVPGATEGE